MTIDGFTFVVLLLLPPAAFVFFLVFLILYFCTRKERQTRFDDSVNGFLIGSIIAAVAMAVFLAGDLLLIFCFPQMIRLMG